MALLGDVCPFGYAEGQARQAQEGAHHTQVPGRTFKVPFPIESHAEC